MVSKISAPVYAAVHHVGALALHQQLTGNVARLKTTELCNRQQSTGVSKKGGGTLLAPAGNLDICKGASLPLHQALIMSAV